MLVYSYKCFTFAKRLKVIALLRKQDYGANRMQKGSFVKANQVIYRLNIILKKV